LADHAIIIIVINPRDSRDELRSNRRREGEEPCKERQIGTANERRERRSLGG
jgi:hypothetical protein